MTIIESNDLMTIYQLSIVHCSLSTVNYLLFIVNSYHPSHKGNILIFVDCGLLYSNYVDFT